MPTCYRHPSRETGVSCSNCGRPICPDCMTPTSVGMRCPECAGETTKVRSVPRRTAKNPYGGRPFTWSDLSTWSVTDGLIAINVIVFLLEVATGLKLLGGNCAASSVCLHGVQYSPFLAHGYDEYWRLLTAGFLHENILHIGMNMLALWYIGRMLEPAIGKAYFVAIYFASLLVGSFGVVLLEPQGASLGASGAIFGLFGALLIVARARRIPIWQSGLGPLLLLNVIFTFTFPDISIGAHVGGFVGGLFTGWIVMANEHRRSKALPLLACGATMVAAVAGSLLVAASSAI